MCLVTDNLGLVGAVIKREFSGYHEELRDDMFSVGYMALVLSARNYDSVKARFSTYAWKAIIRAIWRLINSEGKHRHFEYTPNPYRASDAYAVEFVEPLDEKVGTKDWLGQLSSVEDFIVRYIASGHSRADAGLILGVSRQMICNHLKSAGRKYRLQRRKQCFANYE